MIPKITTTTATEHVDGDRKGEEDVENVPLLVGL
jgi:hypothetical protein